MHIDFADKSTSKSISPKVSKYQFDTLNCSLEELAVLERVAQNPSIKQQELVSATGKSIATVKRIITSLQDKNYIRRENGKRYGKQSILFRLLLKIGWVEKWSFNKENRPNLYYPFYINPATEDEHGLHEISLEPKDGWIELYPLESQGVNTVWRWGKQKSQENLNVNIKAKPMRNGSYNRKFIMVQLPERTDEKSEAYKAGYKNICEIGKERIRRAGRKIKEDSPLTTQDLDIGFRVLKCDTSNMKEVYYNPAEYEASLFPRLEDNIKEDRTPEDLLFQVMLDLGVLLSSKIEETTIAGKKVFNVEDNYLIACFDSNVTEETIKAIAKQKPYYFVMRDSSMANDSVATNFDQIFATYSPDTVRKVL